MVDCQVTTPKPCFPSLYVLSATSEFLLAILILMLTPQLSRSVFSKILRHCKKFSERLNRSGRTGNRVPVDPLPPRGLVQSLVRAIFTIASPFGHARGQCRLSDRANAVLCPECQTQPGLARLPFFPQTAWEWSEWLSEADCVTKLRAKQRVRTAAEN